MASAFIPALLFSVMIFPETVRQNNALVHSLLSGCVLSEQQTLTRTVFKNMPCYQSSRH